MSDNVNLKIDGQPVSVPKGTNILEAARTIGVDIPYFCYHPGLSSPAVCRQCLVDQKGSAKLIPACYTPVSENMEITTSSEKVKTARAQMLEFTLVNHPVDCPICDKAGECTLQKLYHEFDAAHSRIDHQKVHKPKIVDLGPEIVLDVERCISCTRCIRVCDEVAKEHQLEMSYRGDRTQLSVAPGKQLDNPYSLNTVDVCPVGALTSKDFRFTMRAWELYTTPSVCAGCATGCNIEIHHARGRIYRLVPRANADVNKYWMCDEGRMTYKEIGERRVAGARLRGEPAPMDKAIAFAAERLAALRDAGAGGLVGVVLHAQATNEDNWALLKVADLLGAGQVYLAGRPLQPEREDSILRAADVNPNTAGVRAIAGTRGKGLPQLDADLDAGVLRGLILLGSPVELDEDALAAIAKLDIAIYLTPHDDALAERAHVVLPAATWAEVDGTYTNAKGRVERVRQAVEPPGEARPSWELTALVAKRLGLAVELASARAIFADLQKAVGAFAGASFGREAPQLQLRFAGSRG
jgi:NADH-quinone oxidoreductase subunit G